MSAPALSRQGGPRRRDTALLRGLIFGIDGRALSPVHTLRRGGQYRYYVSQSVLKGDAIDDPSLVRSIAAAEIEDAVMAQVRELLWQSEIIVGTWRAAQADVPDITEAEKRAALESLDPTWGSCSPVSRRGSCRRWSTGSRSDRPALTSASRWRV